jgi:hypothetical protein
MTQTETIDGEGGEAISRYLFFRGWNILYNDQLCYSFGLCGIRTTENMNEFKEPLVVACYNVDYMKNRKGKTYTFFLCFHCVIAMGLLVTGRETTPKISTTPRSLPSTK